MRLGGAPESVGTVLNGLRCSRIRNWRWSSGPTGACATLAARPISEALANDLGKFGTWTVREQTP
jgi:hypothetical protein